MKGLAVLALLALVSVCRAGCRRAVRALIVAYARASAALHAFAAPPVAAEVERVQTVSQPLQALLAAAEVHAKRQAELRAALGASAATIDAKLAEQEQQLDQIRTKAEQEQHDAAITAAIDTLVSWRCCSGGLAFVRTATLTGGKS